MPARDYCGRAPPGLPGNSGQQTRVGGAEPGARVRALGDTQRTCGLSLRRSSVFSECGCECAVYLHHNIAAAQPSPTNDTGTHHQHHHPASSTPCGSSSHSGSGTGTETAATTTTTTTGPRPDKPFSPSVVVVPLFPSEQAEFPNYNLCQLEAARESTGPYSACRDRDRENGRACECNGYCFCCEDDPEEEEAVVDRFVV